jgi:ATP-dependent DNA helicase DinG
VRSASSPCPESAAIPPGSLRDLVDEFFAISLAGTEGFEVRPAQREMASAVARVLVEGGRLAVEAETGTGKSLAYLVPLLLHESGEGRPAVIATKTLQLQEQLLQKELPFLQSQLPAPRKVVQARGWSNYLCLRKVETPVEDTVRQLGADLPFLRNLVNRGQGRLIRQEVQVSAASWCRVQADPLDCQKQNCPHFSKCGLFAERRELESADIIVTNHAFLLSDLKVRRDGGGLLPACDVLILDEAHRLDAVATDHLTVRVDAERLASTLSMPLKGWLETVRFALLAHLPEAHLLDWSAKFDLHVVLALKDLEGLGADLLAELAALRQIFPGVVSVPHSLLGVEAGEATANLASELAFGIESLVGNLVALGLEYDELAPVNAPPELARLARGLQNLAGDLDFLLSGSDSEWVFLCDLQPPALLARPVDNSQTLDAELFAGFATVVVTSATLKVNNSFEFFFQRTGLGLEPTEELSLTSPFDAARATFVGLANQGPDPSEPSFVESLLPHLEQLAVGLGGRTFILTTSHRSLLELARSLSDPLGEAGIDLLVQGQAPPGQLLRRFALPGAHVLLGVDTFWEGVDIPGERLSCVVLTRLPFPVPTDPLFAARCQRIDERGGRAFDELSIPMAALKLKQGFGRLLRSSQDRGVFLLLDPRVGRKAYGRILERHLPGGHARKGSAEELVRQALVWAETNL